MRYVWKEWRDNRAVVLGFLVALPLLQLVAALVAPEKFVGDPVFATASAAMGLCVAALAFAGDLVPGEARRGTLGFLDRLPRGLTAAFLGKAAFLALAASTFTLYAYATATLVQSWFAETSGLDPRVQVYGLLAVGVVAWVFVVSTWLPRGTLALPATAIVLGLFALPIHLALAANPGLRLPPDVDDIFQWWMLAGAFGAAWYCFARGRRFGRGAWASAWRGLVVLALLFTPAWSFVADQVADYRYFDAEDEGAVIRSGYLGTGGRYLFLNGHMGSGERPTHAFIVDLKDASWRRAGGPGEMFMPVGSSRYQWEWDRCGPLPAVARHESGPFEKAWMHYHDGRTAEVIKSGWSDMRFPEVERLHARGPACAPEGWRAFGRFGLGYCVEKDDRRELWDPFRGRRYSYRVIAEYDQVRIRPGAWLALRGKHYVLFDPDTLEGRLAPEVTHVDWFLPDGRVVATRGGKLVVIDPESGRRIVLGEASGQSSGIAAFPDGRWLVAVNGRYARLDPDAGTLEPFPALDGDFETIAIENDDTVVGIHRKRFIIRARVGDGTREILFPR